MTHLFRSATAIVAFCGEVERPNGRRIYQEGAARPHPVCPECATEHDALMAVVS